MKNRSTLFLFMLLMTGVCKAQHDKHYSMWNESQSMLNAGAVGMMDEDLRFLANYRMQWLTLDGQAFTSGSFSVDGKVKINNSFNTVGVGVNFTNDLTGDSRITSNVVSVPLAFNVALDRSNFVSIGFSPGIIMQSLGTGYQTWDNQWDGEGFDQSIATGEFYNNSISSFDLGAGIYYKSIIDENTQIKGGISLNHLNAPNLSFVGMNTGLFRNLNIMISGSKFSPLRKFGFAPQALFSFMGPNNNILLGSYFEHELFESSARTDYVQRSFFSYGLFIRWNDAVIASLAYKTGGLKVGLSYDVNFSPLRTITKTVGAAEVFLKYSMRLDKSGYIHDRRFFRWKGKGRL
jgi:type IX secretion system PorP/SprF family membrane protein